MMGNNYQQAYEYYEQMANFYFDKSRTADIKALLPVVKQCYVEAATNLKAVRVVLIVRYQR